jgi:hypothetical protein
MFDGAHDVKTGTQRAILHNAGRGGEGRGGEGRGPAGRRRFPGYKGAKGVMTWHLLLHCFAP